MSKTENNNMPMAPNNEKAKNFGASIKKIFKDMKKWQMLIIIAIILATTSSVLSLISPNKLSDLTDQITKGLVPNTKKLEEITKEISYNFSDQEKMKEKVQLVISSPNISYIEKQNFISNLNKLSTNEEQSLVILNQIPDQIMLILLDDIEIDNIKLSKLDQLKTLKILSNIDPKNMNSSMEAFDKLPDKVYDLVKPQINMEIVKNIGIFLVIIFLISALFSYIQAVILAGVSNNYAKDLRNRISKKINILPLKYFDSHETGDILSRVTNDVDSISQNLSQSLGSLVSGVTLFVGAVIMMFITNWVMALTAIVASLLGFGLMGFILNKSQIYFNKRQKELGKLNGHIEEIYSAHNVVQAYNGEIEAEKEFDTLNKNLYTYNKKSQFLSGIMPPLMGFTGNFGYVAVCIVGGVLTFNGIISFGVIVAFMIYVRLFTSPLSQIAQAMTGLQSTAAASERVFEFISEEEMKDQKNIEKELNKNKVLGNIEFKNLNFGYNKEKPIIKNFSVNISSGQKIAIVGPTGAGKTTLVNLLMKFYEIDSGDIIIDGISIKELSRENIHDLFTMVLQDTWLFDGTIKENVKFNHNKVSDKQIWNALETVGVDHFVKTLPGGIDAKIDDGEAISLGQKQLLTIARGMIKNAPFLILDEATSNVDTRTEELVQEAMNKLTLGKTSFIIAHRLSTIKNADIILVMKNGNIVEQGSHKELMKKNGFYSKLYNSQFEL